VGVIPQINAPDMILHHMPPVQHFEYGPISTAANVLSAALTPCGAAHHERAVTTNHCELKRS